MQLSLQTAQLHPTSPPQLYGASPVLAVLPDSDQLRLDAMARVEEEVRGGAKGWG